ncbi:MAG: hypothetical protein JWQ36_1575 [Enterovirga sp.]|jgi:hypothetical protein|nr:hypothetical protein [Enterovirga sp.]
MPRIRFAAAREVFEAFPALSGEVRAQPSGEPPMAYLRALAAGETPEDALTFCAYALRPREAVWWGCQCVRSIAQIAPGQEDPCLLAAEEWVRQPEDERRVMALRLGGESDRRGATPWLALGAGWAGGTVSLDEGGYLASRPDMTANAVRTAVLIALARVSAKERGRRLGMCVDGGVRLMQHEAAEGP